MEKQSQVQTDDGRGRGGPHRGPEGVAVLAQVTELQAWKAWEERRLFQRNSGGERDKEEPKKGNRAQNPTATECYQV